MPQLTSTNPAEPSAELKLPEPPASESGQVKAWSEPVTIRSYMPGRADRNPMFLEKRVYQGSSGRVYPLPFVDRIATEPEMKQWQAIHIENEYLRLMVLPEIGGRIHIGYDKAAGYDFFYRQNVIKPALVGLAGPWVSGGVEFNWPQHHRPATFMSVQTEIERDRDGSITVWCSDHDPMLRMKGMHGICLRPGSCVIELKVRLFNRTPFTQTFLWWANVATRVHEKYQSFFPTDVRFVADHAKRAITSFPRSHGSYYGVDYAQRACAGVAAEERPRLFMPDGSYPADDLSWYSNIPVPTSYMVTATEYDFFGGYDHAVGAGFVHVADHHIAPGKKQWTWGNHEFGYAWDCNLTDKDGPYIELMAGVYTDNQPDFSYLAPWETKTFTQSWYPLRAIGVPQAANLDAALSLRTESGRTYVGVYVTRPRAEVTVALRAGATEIARWTAAVDVEHPLLLSTALPAVIDLEAIAARVTAEKQTLIEYDPALEAPAKTPAQAQEPAQPSDIATIEELYLTGLHLDQYRHATRQPELYWSEALLRDPEDCRVNNALGLWRLRRGEFAAAVHHFQVAIARLTRLNPNPHDSEAYYNLGLAERFRNQSKSAYDSFYKATWSAAWRGPAYFALAEMDACKGDWKAARDHLERSLRAEADNLNARNLLVYILGRLGRDHEALSVHRETGALDPLDLGTRWRDGIEPANGQERLDLAFDLMRSGQNEEAARVLHCANAFENDGSLPMVLFTLAQIGTHLGHADADITYEQASHASLDYCFPSRLEELGVLQATIALHPDCAPAYYLLGNYLYDRRRHEEAIEAWEHAAALDPAFATVWRNLGIAFFNARADTAASKSAFDRALAARPDDARVFYERDQLWKRTGGTPQRRLSELERNPDLVGARDDLSVELATLYNQLARPAQALDLLLKRHFQPWEGGEGLVLAQYARARLLLGQAKLAAGDAGGALEHFKAALDVPENLSERRHLLANQSDLYYWLGSAYEALGDSRAAKAAWLQATRQRTDFQQMSVRSISNMTYWAAMSHLRLGAHAEATDIFQRIYDYAVELEKAKPKIDYFATSLPAMLLFEEDLYQRNRIEALTLRAQACSGLDRKIESAALLKEVLELDRNNSTAADLLRAMQEVAVGTQNRIGTNGLTGNRSGRKSFGTNGSFSHISQKGEIWGTPTSVRLKTTFRAATV